MPFNWPIYFVTYSNNCYIFNHLQPSNTILPIYMGDCILFVIGLLIGLGFSLSFWNPRGIRRLLFITGCRLFLGDSMEG